MFRLVVLNSDSKTTVDTSHPPVFSQIQSALQRLSFLSVAELERVFTESLDSAAHRLDAYVTAMATRRLLVLRRQLVIGLRQQGVIADEPTTKLTYFGGYGLVEDVRPVARTTKQINGVTFDVQLDNGGYIHAPSPRHATAAAILRSGRMAENSDPTKYAIELPSDRARRARLLVDGVRNGQPLGELLGFELETNLRQRAQTEQITGTGRATSWRCASSIPWSRTSRGSTQGSRPMGSPPPTWSTARRSGTPGARRAASHSGRAGSPRRARRTRGSSATRSMDSTRSSTRSAISRSPRRSSRSPPATWPAPRRR